VHPVTSEECVQITAAGPTRGVLSLPWGRLRHVAIVFCILQASGGVTGKVDGPAIADLSWLAGCWRQEASGRIVDEVWMAPAGDAIFGMSRTVAKDRAVAHEFMQIRSAADGLVFIARPSGQPEATFRLVKSGARELVFENPTHDFPQRVMYRLASPDALVGRIEGTEKGRTRGVDFPMRRVACH
jgi:hypothetical protein